MFINYCSEHFFRMRVLKQPWKTLLLCFVAFLVVFNSVPTL